MDSLEIFLRVCMLGFSLILTITALISVKRTKGAKLLFACVAFVIFTLEGLLLVLGIFISPVESAVNVTTLMAFNMLALVFFYGSVAN